MDERISETVSISMLEKLEDGTYKLKYPRTLAQLVVETEEKNFVSKSKIDLWNSNPTQEELDQGLEDKLDISEKGIAGGVATLDSNMKIPKSQIPVEVGGQTYVVSTNEERDGLDELEVGDKVYVTESGNNYLWDGIEWKLNSNGGSGNIDLQWSNIKNIPEEFNPEEHTHVIGEVANLEVELNKRAKKDFVEEESSKREDLEVDIEETKKDVRENKKELDENFIYYKNKVANGNFESASEEEGDWRLNIGENDGHFEILDNKLKVKEPSTFDIANGSYPELPLKPGDIHYIAFKISDYSRGNIEIADYYYEDLVSSPSFFENDGLWDQIHTVRNGGTFRLSLRDFQGSISEAVILNLTEIYGEEIPHVDVIRKIIEHIPDIYSKKEPIAIGARVIQTVLESYIGNVEKLNTRTQENLVSAINENKVEVDKVKDLAYLSGEIVSTNLLKNPIPYAVNGFDGTIHVNDYFHLFNNYIEVNPSKTYSHGCLNNNIHSGYIIAISYFDESYKFIDQKRDLEFVRNDTESNILPMIEEARYVLVEVNNNAKDEVFLNEGSKPYFMYEDGVIESGVERIIPDNSISISKLGHDVKSNLSSEEAPYPKELRWEMLDEKGLTIRELSRDGKVIYGSRENGFYQSTDEGDSWQLIVTVPEGHAQGVREIEDGELLFTTQNISNENIKGHIYKTTGYSTDLSKEVTVRIVLSSSTENTRFSDEWGLDAHDNIVVAGEYGQQGEANHVYLSTDYGNNFKLIFNQANTAGIEGAPEFTNEGHIHTCIYDRYWGRIWVVTGDGPVRGVYYSDDLGESWSAVEEFSGKGMQFTGMTSYPEGVIFGSDLPPDGVYRWWRTANKSDKVVIEPYIELERLKDVRTVVFAKAFRRFAEKDEVTYFLGGTDSANGEEYGALLVGLKGFKGAHLISDFGEGELAHKYSAVNAVVGDTAGGNILTTVLVREEGTYAILRAKSQVWE